MIEITYLKPFQTRVRGNKLRLVFAYQYLTIHKDEETFHFIPIEGKEILIDTQTRQVTNLNEVFVFQKGNRFIRMPLYQFLLITNAHNLLNGIIDDNVGKKQEVPPDARTLSLELDYELASLSRAMKTGDLVEKARSEKRLQEIHKELEELESAVNYR